MGKKRKRTRSKRYPSIGSVVRFLRTCAGLSQQKLAGQCEGNLSPNDISKIERGNLGVKLYKVLSIAAFFDITLECIVKNDFQSLGATLPSGISNLHQQKKTQYKKAQTKKDAAGVRGQTLVVGWETARLRSSGLERLVSFADDESAGFDVFSFTEKGSPLYIEVKSSVGEEKQFFMTENERSFAQYCLENDLPYRLYSIKSVFDKNKRSYKTYTAAEVLGLTFVNYNYIVKEK